MQDAIDEIGLHSRQIDDADMQAAMQPWIAMDCFQLSHGRQLAHVDSLNFGRQQIVRECQDAAVQKIGIMPPNLCTVSYCTPAPTFRFSELNAGSADTIFFMPEHNEFDLYVPAGAQTAYVSFNQDEFLRDAQALNPVQWGQAPQQVLSIRSRQQDALRQVINLSLQSAEASKAFDHPQYAETLQAMLLQEVLQIAVAAESDDPQPSSIERARALHVCRAARELVAERLAAGEIPTIVDICINIGVSERTLQYAFRTYVDMSPLVYLRLCRLNHVRATLRVSDPSATTITEVAMRFGFVHLGRFSSDYKQLFGEMPSVTLAA